ncbi:phosphoribosyltransferase [Oleiharenicola sp. Vm1]|uniref:phosphoribosyltransferase n=1 Tax=Oleiharenicola sp. Vm1 TaxID=3398393 RepID=UPI0039F5D976
MVFPWPKGFPRIYSTATVEQVSGHPDFEAAKHGDRTAAVRLVDSIADRDLMRAVGLRYPGAGLVVVASPTAENGNQIPYAFASLFSTRSGLPLQQGVVKTNKPAHTGRGAAYRFAHRAEYAGHLDAGRNYVLLDDVATQGGTISELRQFVYQQRASVVAVATLAYTPSRAMSDGRTLPITRETFVALDQKHGMENVSRMLAGLGIYEGNVQCLTESEAKLIFKAQSLDAFINEIRHEQQRSQPMPPLPSHGPRSGKTLAAR